MEKTISGLKVKGNWDEVVETGEEVSEALKETEFEEEIEDWEYWRPRRNEEIQNEVKEKTIEMASINKGPIEDSNKSPKQELIKSLYKIKDSITIRSKDFSELKQGTRKLGITIRALIRKTFRKFEETVYEHVISKTNPHYFDGERVSASLDRKKGLVTSDSEYILHVNVNDDELCKKIQKEIKN